MTFICYCACTVLKLLCSAFVFVDEKCSVQVLTVITMVNLDLNSIHTNTHTTYMGMFASEFQTTDVCMEDIRLSDKDNRAHDPHIHQK
jgi:hypothetical protein